MKERLYLYRGNANTDRQLIPQGIGMLLTRSWAGKVADRDGPRTIMLFSLTITAIGTLPFAFCERHR
jgi:predicted MFS family arabinose efflux permease